MADRIGQQLGNYRLVRLLGHGGFADVYLGEHIHLNTLAAIKVLHTELAGQNEIEKFRNEARIIAQLEHHHIVRVLDFGLQDNIPFLVMNYAAKGSLRDLHPKGTILPQASIVLYVKHILVRADGSLILSDFGIAIRAHNSHSMIFQNEAGTIPYMAPEQIHGNARPASDQYALGIVVYHWFCGTYPFKGSYLEIATQHLSMPPLSLHERIPSISPGIDQVVMTALSKDPKQRFMSVQSFATALEEACSVPQESLTLLPTATPQDQASQPTGTETFPALSSQPTHLVSQTDQPSEHTNIAEKQSQFSESFYEIPSVNQQLLMGMNNATFDQTSQPPYLATHISRSIRHSARSNSFLIRIFIGIFLLLFSIAIISFDYYKGSEQVKFDSTATSIAQSKNTSNFSITRGAQTIGSSTPQAYLTSQTSQQAAIATARAITNTSPILADDLSTDFISDWYVDYKNCTFINNTYHAIVKQNNAFQACTSSVLSYNNAALQVEVSLLAGSDAGFILRATNQQYYDFGIDNQGNFFFRRHDPNGSGGGSFTDLIPATRSNAILPGKRNNTLFVIANGSNFDLFINGVFVGEYQDNNYASGQVGFSVETYSTVKAGEASFSNFKVYSIAS